MKEFDILSFDGGGSKGVMEVIILQDVMNAVTLLVNDPVKILSKVLGHDEKELFDNIDDRHDFAQLLDHVQDPIHPTHVFDMIVGTSTGALISFGLVGGKEDAKTGDRIPMSVQEVIDMYAIATPRIFQTSHWIQRVVNFITTKVAGVPIFPYGQEGLERLLLDYYGSTTLKDFEGPCIAAAVARKFDASSGGNTLEIFDTKSAISFKVKDVLKASADAPVFFRTPTRIAEADYVDGGVGGNCPLAQAIPRMKELVIGTPNSVLSISPPKTVMGGIPDRGEVLYWLQYFPTQMTDGFAVYNDVKKHYDTTICQRLFPNSIEARGFPMDELDIQAMIMCMDKEKRADPAYFRAILSAALIIAARIVKENLDQFASICGFVINWSLHHQDPENALNISKAMMKVFRNGKDELRYAKSLYFLGRAYFDLEKFSDAKNQFLQCMGILRDHEYEDDLKGFVLEALGRSFYHLGVFDKSEEAFLEVLAGKKEHRSLTLAELSTAQRELNKFKEAMENAEKAVEEADEMEALTAYLGKGLCHMAMEEFRLALDDFAKVDITEDEDEDKLLIAELKSYRGHCNLSLGNLGSALILHVNALEIFKTIPEVMHDDNVIMIHNLAGEFYIHAAYFSKALICLEQAHKLSMSMFSKVQHPSSATTLTLLGHLMIELGEHEDARGYLEQALEMQNEVFTESKCKHPSMIKTYGCMAKLEYLENDTTKALKIIEKGLKMANDLLPEGLSHTWLLIIKAEILMKDDIDQALEIFDKALEIYEGKLGGESRHPGIAVIKTNMAHISLQKDDLDKALEGIESSLSLLKLTYASIKHPNEAHAWEIRGMILLKQGKYDSAKESFEKAAKILSSVFANHADELKNPMLDRVREQINSM